MSAEWERIEAQFFELVDLPVQVRETRLEALRKTDPELGRELESLIAADASSSRPFSPPGAATLSAALSPAPESAPSASTSFPRTGARAGAWTLEKELGRGGMGSVWSARRTEGGFGQRGAVKLVHAESNERVLARFVQVAHQRDADVVDPASQRCQRLGGNPCLCQHGAVGGIAGQHAVSQPQIGTQAGGTVAVDLDRSDAPAVGRQPPRDGAPDPGTGPRHHHASPLRL